MPREHPFWEKNYPGRNGFGCRCRADAYSRKELERKGLKVSMSPQALAEFRANPPKQNKDELTHLKNIIAQKLKVYVDNPNATQRLQGILQELEVRHKRFGSINELWQKSALKQDVKLDSHTLKIAKVTPKLQNELNTSAEYILLSGWTLRTHTHHKNIDSFDYSLIADMLESVYKTKTNKIRHIMYFTKLGSYYKAVFKVTDNRKEIYLVSLSKSSKIIK